MSAISATNRSVSPTSPAIASSWHATLSTQLVLRANLLKIAFICPTICVVGVANTSPTPTEREQRFLRPNLEAKGLQSEESMRNQRNPMATVVRTIGRTICKTARPAKTLTKKVNFSPAYAVCNCRGATAKFEDADVELEGVEGAPYLVLGAV